MAELPGHVGFGLLGDKTMDFYRDPFGFVARHIEQDKSRVFLTRFLMKPTLFLASNEATKELLNGKCEEFEMGYKDLLFSLYGNNVLFLNGDEAISARAFIKPIFCEHAPEKNWNLIEKLILDWIDSLGDSGPVNVYANFKQFSTQLFIALYLGFESPEVTQEITSLSATHWHGLVSIPVNTKVPSFMTSAHKKAVAAKERILSIIQDKMQSSRNGMDDESWSLYTNHLLMSVSSLMPKALASLLTSFVVSSKLWFKDYTNKQGNLIEEAFDNLLLEIQRCWPPFFGGRRVAVKDTELHGYNIPAGTAVFYVNFAVHRDPVVFADPDKFNPDRWKTDNRNDVNRLFSFGGGPRDCIATHLVQKIVKIICRHLVQKYYWDPIVIAESDIRWFPVTRPKQDPLIQFVAKCPK